MVANSVSTLDELDHGTNSLFSRTQMVSRILELNPTTTVSYLASFSDASLGQYLARLTALDQPRLTSKGWVLRGGTPAIAWREALD